MLERVKASNLILDCYLPGMLLPPPDIAVVTGGDFTTATTGAQVDVTGLSISYTPPVDCWIKVFCQLRVSNSNAGIRCLSIIDIGGVTVNVSSLVLGNATQPETIMAFYWGLLTKGTAYTIKGRTYQAAGGGTLTVVDDTDKTQLVVIPTAAPAIP